jgi:hypothetical protein
MGELPLVGYEMGELPLVGFGDVGELPLVGFGDVGESPLAAYEMGELSLVGVSDLYGVDRLYGLNGLASPEDRMSGPFEESGTIGYRKRMYDRPLNGPDNVISMQGVAAAFGV